MYIICLFENKNFFYFNLKKKLKPFFSDFKGIITVGSGSEKMSETLDWYKSVTEYYNELINVRHIKNVYHFKARGECFMDIINVCNIIYYINGKIVYPKITGSSGGDTIIEFVTDIDKNTLIEWIDGEQRKSYRKENGYNDLHRVAQTLNNASDFDGTIVNKDYH